MAISAFINYLCDTRPGDPAPSHFQVMRSHGYGAKDLVGDLLDEWQLELSRTQMYFCE